MRALSQSSTALAARPPPEAVLAVEAAPSSVDEVAAALNNEAVDHSSASVADPKADVMIAVDTIEAAEVIVADGSDGGTTTSRSGRGRRRSISGPSGRCWRRLISIGLRS